MKRTIAALLFLGSSAAPAFGQSASPAFVRGFGGVTFMSETGGVVGGTVGVRLSRTFDVIGDAGRFSNVLPRGIQRDLDAAARAMGTAFGAPVTIDGKAPGAYVFGGIRANRTTAQRMTMFIEGGAGVAHGTSRIAARAGGVDVSREVTAALRIKPSERRGLVAVGGGVGIPLSGRLALDLGYRYMRIFTDDPRINTGTMTAGFRWGF